MATRQKKFSELLAWVGDEYHILPSTVCELLELHTFECGTRYLQGFDEGHERAVTELSIAEEEHKNTTTNQGDKNV